MQGDLKLHIFFLAVLSYWISQVLGLQAVKIIHFVCQIFAAAIACITTTGEAPDFMLAKIKIRSSSQII